ncbi:MAG: hypothetical protein JNL01_00305 [Bdellovibrionales bacterium]|nr:hypothetical protein [Bdellovibrionales bacterium]
MRALFLGFVCGFSVITGVSPTAWAIQKSQTWVGQNPAGLQVQFDSKTSGIAVTIPQKDDNPKSLTITLLDAKGNKTHLELKAMDPWQMPGVDRQIARTHFSGTLSPANQSFVGFEIRIPLGSDAPVVVRSKDLKKTN